MAEIIKDWKDILEQEDMNKVHLPGDVEDPWNIRILLLLEHHINIQLEFPPARYSRTLECKYIPDLLTLLHAGRKESLQRMELAPPTPLNKAIHSPTTSYMADEHYVLLRTVPNFAHRFSLIFINTINRDVVDIRWDSPPVHRSNETLLLRVVDIRWNSPPVHRSNETLLLRSSGYTLE